MFIVIEFCVCNILVLRNKIFIICNEFNFLKFIQLVQRNYILNTEFKSKSKGFACKSSFKYQNAPRVPFKQIFYSINNTVL